MAALNTIAREYADEIRDGIAWVIVWKTGRSWNAEAFWLNCDDDTFESEDLEQAREILKQDPSAVMVNGYCCGHFGEDMTVAELAAGIRWHYENGTNLLKDSDAFPPEPIERPEGLPADMPWYGKATGAEPDPYVYDGYMSAEDYELMHKHMEADRQQEEAAAAQLPERRGSPGVALTLTIAEPDQARTILTAAGEAITAAMDKMTQALRAFADWLTKAAITASKIVCDTVNRFTDAMLYRANDHPKWWHLYKHDKKYRVRKKYRKRLMQQLVEKLRAAPTMEVIT